MKKFLIRMVAITLALETALLGASIFIVGAANIPAAIFIVVTMACASFLLLRK